MYKIEFLALSGDFEAQKICTKNGYAIACPICYKKANLRSSIHGQYYICCKSCGLSTKTYNSKYEALRKWNTRCKLLKIIKDKKEK